MNRTIELGDYQAQICKSRVKDMIGLNMLRVFNHSPDRIALQIRDNTRYATVTLSDEQVEDLIGLLRDAIAAMHTA